MQMEKASLIERLNFYIGKVDDAWISSLIGASKEDIDLLKKYSGLKEHNLELPNSFIEFIDKAGEGDGGLISNVLNGKMSVKRLVDINKGIYEMWPETMHPFEFEFLYDEVGIPYIIKLGNNNEIEYENTCYISSSFENLLFQCAVRKYEEMFYKKKIRFGASIKSFKESKNRRKEDTIMSIMDELIKEYNLECAWFNDNYFFCARNDIFSIILLKRVAMAGQLSGNDISQMDDFLRRLLPMIGAEIQSF